jgi:hypothetical protein
MRKSILQFHQIGVSIWLAVLLTSSAFAQFGQPRVPQFRQGNNNLLGMRLSLIGELVTPSSSLTVLTEIRTCEACPVAWQVNMLPVGNGTGLIRGQLPNLGQGIYYWGLRIKRANGEIPFAGGIGKLQVLPTGALESISDATGYTININEDKLVTYVNIGSEPGAAIAAYLAGEMRKTADSIFAVQDGIDSSATVAQANAAAALTYKNAAATSAGQASASATAAQTFSQQAQTYAGNANTSAGNASTSEANALTYKNAASTSAGQSSASAAAAATSASNATSSAQASATSAGQSSASATAAQTSATNANNSATAAATSAGQASASATAAATSAQAAATSASQASASATAAATSASNAQASYTATAALVANRVVTAASVATTYTIDLSQADNTFAFITLTGNTTLTISNAAQGKSLYLRVVQGGAGSFTLTFPAGVKFPGGSAIDWNTTAGSVNVFSLVASSSSAYDGFYSKQ